MVHDSMPDQLFKGLIIFHLIFLDFVSDDNHFLLRLGNFSLANHICDSL